MDLTINKCLFAPKRIYVKLWDHLFYHLYNSGTKYLRFGWGNIFPGCKPILEGVNKGGIKRDVKILKEKLWNLTVILWEVQDKVVSKVLFTELSVLLLQWGALVKTIWLQDQGIAHLRIAGSSRF